MNVYEYRCLIRFEHFSSFASSSTSSDWQTRQTLGTAVRAHHWMYETMCYTIHTQDIVAARSNSFPTPHFVLWFFFLLSFWRRLFLTFLTYSFVLAWPGLTWNRSTNDDHRLFSMLLVGWKRFSENNIPCAIRCSQSIDRLMNCLYKMYRCRRWKYKLIWIDACFCFIIK